MPDASNVMSVRVVWPAAGTDDECGDQQHVVACVRERMRDAGEARLASLVQQHVDAEIPQPSRGDLSPEKALAPTFSKLARLW